MSHETLHALTNTLNSSTYDDHAEKLPNMGVRHKVSDLRIKAKKVEQDSAFLTMPWGCFRKMFP